MGISGIGSHDTGRTKNGRDTAESEKRSAEKTIAAVNEAYPGAAGPAWTAQLQANITSASAAQETIEGYLFKSADSLDYSRIDKLDEAQVVDLVENVIRERPQDFPLLSKYYLGAGQAA